jgi:glycosyltransferase involved in cell wall biosynthesis
MRILLLSQYYFPEPVEKVHDLARGLARRGHEVEVLTGFPCYPHGKIYPGYRQRLSFVETIDGVKVRRIPQMPDHGTRSLRRALYYLSFAASAAVLGTLFTPRPDVILVYQAALPVGLAARVLRVTRRAPYVLDVVDLWPESVTASSMLNNRLAVRVLRWLIAGIYAGAARIRVVTEGFRRNLVAHEVPVEKLTVIHNWMPDETYRAAPRDERVAAREDLAGRFVVMYAGNMGAPQGLDTVIEAAALLGDRSDIVFALVGGGTEQQRLRQMAADRRLDNVRFLGRRPPGSMHELYAIADVLLVHLKRDELTDLSIPSKTFAYMASGKTVLMAAHGDAADFVAGNRFGVVVEPSDPVVMADAVRRLQAMTPQELKRIGENGLEAFRAKYCGEVQVVRFEQLLREAQR